MSTLALIWHALSFGSVLVGGTGLGLILVAALGLIALPSALTRPLMALGAVLLIAGALYQTAYARATHAAELRKAQEIAETARKRAETAEAALEADQTRAAADAATIEAMRKEIDATPADPGGCLPADAARRVRRIR